jgi:hypothetical protein
VILFLIAVNVLCGLNRGAACLWPSMNTLSVNPNFLGGWLETRMDSHSPRGVAEAWRQQGFSGQPFCRMAMGAAYRGAPSKNYDTVTGDVSAQ